MALQRNIRLLLCLRRRPTRRRPPQRHAPVAASCVELVEQLGEQGAGAALCVGVVEASAILGIFCRHAST